MFQPAPGVREEIQTATVCRYYSARRAPGRGAVSRPTQVDWRRRSSPRSAAREQSGGRPGQDADLDVHAGGKAEALVERLDGLAGRLQDVDQTLVRPDLKLLARLAVNMRTPQHGVPFDA